jgi:RNA polymerase sigma factor (sigma-70 family)
MRQTVRQFVRAAATAGTAGSSDSDLLRRFIDAADQDAFAELVRRHGPVVLDVCRCVLGNHADAEDAFQATFLVLARRAGSIRRAGSLAAWLHGVAYRIARKAQTRAAKRREHEAKAPAREPSAHDNLSWAEVRLAVHEALAALSAIYREPLVLCYLGGLTQDQAASALKLSDSALKKRLERGREKLRAALTRRGLGPAALLAALATPAAVCAVPQSLADAAGNLSAGTVAPSILTLARAELATMVLSPLKAALCVLSVLVVGAVLAGTAPQQESRAQDPVPAPAPTVPLRADGKKPLPAEKQETFAEQEARWLAGEWKVAFIEAGGKNAFPDEDFTDARIVFKDGKAEVKGLKTVFIPNFSFKIDPMPSPKEIDVTFLDGDRKGDTFAGAYVTHRTEVRICLRLEHTKLGRPKGFSTVSGAGLYTFFLRPVDEKGPPPVKPVGAQFGAPAAPTAKVEPKFDVVLRDDKLLYFVLTRPAENFFKSLAVVGEHLDLAIKIAESTNDPDVTIVFFLRNDPKHDTGAQTGVALKTMTALPADKRAAKLLEYHWMHRGLPSTATLFTPDAKGKPQVADPNAAIRKKWEEIPVPAQTPFDGDAKKRDAYLNSFRRGYFWAGGVPFLGPTDPQKDNLHAVRGWVEGWQAGAKAGGTGDLPAKYAPYLVWRQPDEK